MTGSGPIKRLARFGTGVLVLLVVHGFVMTSIAWAGCNHLVLSHLDTDLRSYGLDELIVEGASSPLNDSLQYPLEQSSPGRRMPCTGLRCSSRDPLPVPIAFQGPSGPNQWVTLSAVVVLEHTSSRVLNSDELVPRPAARNSAVFHPPRN